MDETIILFAKIAALKKNFDSITYAPNGRTLGGQVEPLLDRYQTLLEKIKINLPEFYADLPTLPMPKSRGASVVGDKIFDSKDINPLARQLDYVLEVRAHSRIGEKEAKTDRNHFIFLSHGQSAEWRKMQAFVERELGFQTIELTQQPNLGRTVMQKLDEESDKCGLAIIVMTGDDKLAEGEMRARENVMHEIGFFQGKLGLDKIVILHEEGVNIPSNIHGLVYIPFPKDTVEATFGALTKELKILMA